ncbi:MAG: DUF1614 domain-containing protein, partial [Candidatus Paceibacterota bacterium]
QVITFGFESLGIPPAVTFFVLLAILLGSSINIPLTKKKKFYQEQSGLFDMFERPTLKVEGVAINLGGAIIPLGISAYFLTKVPLYPTIIATVVIIAISKYSATVSKRGVTLPFFIPPIVSALLALLLVPEYAAPVAFIAGVMGTLIGADLLNLREARKMGMVYIGGAGVFDGIFLVGIMAVILTSL